MAEGGHYDIVILGGGSGGYACALRPRIVASEAKKEATSREPSPGGILTSLIADSYWRAIRRLLIGRTIQRGSLRLGP